MDTGKSVLWFRMILAFAAILLVAGSGLSLAAGPIPGYIPVSSIILGPGAVAPSSVTRYIVRVTFVNGATADFPPTMGATFTVLPAGASVTSDFKVTAPATGPRIKLNATFTENGVLTTASRIIAVQ